MFTGIITSIGRIEAVEPRGDLRVRIACDYDLSTVDLGASVACSGVCLTVVDKGAEWFAVDISGETQDCTPTAMWRAGSVASRSTVRSGVGPPPGCAESSRCVGTTSAMSPREAGCAR